MWENALNVKYFKPLTDCSNNVKWYDTMVHLCSLVTKLLHISNYANS